MCQVLKMIAEAEVDQTCDNLGCGVGAILTIYLEPCGVQKVAGG